MDEKNIPIYSIVISEEDEDTGVKAVSFVGAPAIEEGFIALSAQKELQKAILNFNTDELKQIVTGPALIPNQKIFRLDESGEPYYIVFNEDTIEAIAKKFFKQGLTDRTNQEHSNTFFKDNFVFESWLVVDPANDKSKALGFNLPAGTWFLSVYIPDKEFFKNEILSGNTTGFSIEGSFILEEKLKRNNKMKKQDNLFSKVLAALKPLFLEESEPCTDCNKKGDEAKLGSNISRVFEAAIDELVNREENPIPRADIISRVAAEAGIEETTVNQIVSGSIDCPPMERIMGIARGMPNINTEEIEQAWGADGCAMPEEEEQKKEAPTTTAPAELAEIKNELEQKTAIAAELAETVKGLNETLAKLEESLKAAKAEVLEMKKQPAGAPINTNPTAKSDENTKPIPRYKALVQALKKAKR
jgi:hypothetical protein